MPGALSFPGVGVWLCLVFFLCSTPMGVSAQCTTMVKASLSSFFTNMDNKLAVESDRVGLCEMCIKINKYAILTANHPTGNDLETTVATHGCSSYEGAREDDCVSLTHTLVHGFNPKDHVFTPAELNLSVEDLRALVVSKADQRCAELSCCGSRIFRRHMYPETNGHLDREDLDAEARLLAKQEMELVNQRAEILKQKLSLDDHISRIRHDAQTLEKTKNNIRDRRRALEALERRLRHREQRLTEKEQDLSERQKLTPYFLPYPVQGANFAPYPPQQPSNGAPATSPSPSSSPASSSPPASPSPAPNSDPSAAQSTPAPAPPTASLSQTTSPSSHVSPSDAVGGADIDPKDFDETDEENRFLSLLQNMRTRRTNDNNGEDADDLEAEAQALLDDERELNRRIH